MSKDYLWVLAPGLRCIPFSRLQASWVNRYFPRNQYPRSDPLFLLRRPHSRAGPVVVNLSTWNLLKEFRRPSTFLEAVVRISASEPAGPRRILRETKTAVGKLIAAEVLVRVPSKHQGDLRAITPQLVSGDTFLHYRVLKNIHCTSDTEIYQIEEPADGKPHALKLMRATGALTSDRASIRRMLEHEFRTLRSLRGTAACGIVEDGLYRLRPYGILEWIDAVPLARLASGSRDKWLPEAQRRGRLLDLAVRCIEALSSVHERGYLQGDIHPGNFLVEDSGRVRLIDFGLAQAMNQEGTARPRPLGGVIPFLSPESASAILGGRKRIGLILASEIYSLGSVLYYLFTGEYPLELSPTREEALREVSEKPVRSFREVGAEPWPSIEAVLGQALRKEPQHRFLSLADLRSALNACRIGTSATPNVSKRSRPVSDRAFLENVVRTYLTELREFSFPALETSQEPPHASLAFGGAGIAYALLRAAKHFEDSDLLAQAHHWVGHSLAASRKQTALAAPAFGLPSTAVHPGSLYYGMVGLHFVRALVSTAMNDVAGQRDALSDFRSVTRGSRRMPCELMFGIAGQLLGIAHLRAELGSQGLDEAGQLLYEGLLQQRLKTLGYNGLAHGWAGLYFAVVEWSRVSGALLPDWFWPALGRLAETGVWAGKSVRWPIQNDRAPKTYMCSWCNGTPGLVLLWAKAYELSGETVFLRAARGCGWDIVGNAGGVAHLCCGLGGQAYALLALSRLDPSGPWRTHALRLAMKAMGQGRLEHWRNSLFKGKAGLLCLAVDLLGSGPACFPCVEVGP